MMLLPIPVPIVFVVPAAQDVSFTEYQKKYLAAFDKAGFQQGKATEISGLGKRIEVLLTKAGEQFVLTFNNVYIKIEQRLPLADSPAAKALHGPQIKEKFPSVKAEFDAQGVTLSRVDTPAEITPEYMIEDMLADVQGAAKLFSTSAAPMPAPGGSLEAALKDAGLAFSNNGGFYSLKFSFSNTGRSQTAYIRKEIFSSSSLKTRKIVSFCYDAKNAPGAEILKTVFQKHLGIGGFGLEAPEGAQKNWRIFFRIDAPAEISPELLKQYLNLVAATADEIEKELGKEDKL
ncbi:hypothetical protein [Armatimonas sp.]|uniref:hypothetical protein n=1 Tax=Armatimonas sp. TaxID=1872638 RepID=UPI0037532292